MFSDIADWKNKSKNKRMQKGKRKFGGGRGNFVSALHVVTVVTPLVLKKCNCISSLSQNIILEVIMFL
jgi:hypothetical protein